jgi:hypothetical protein
MILFLLAFTCYTCVHNDLHYLGMIVLLFIVIYCCYRFIKKVIKKQNSYIMMPSSLFNYLVLLKMNDSMSTYYLSIEDLSVCYSPQFVAEVFRSKRIAHVTEISIAYSASPAMLDIDPVYWYQECTQCLLLEVRWFDAEIARQFILNGNVAEIHLDCAQSCILRTWRIVQGNVEDFHRHHGMVYTFDSLASRTFSHPALRMMDMDVSEGRRIQEEEDHIQGFIDEEQPDDDANDEEALYEARAERYAEYLESRIDMDDEESTLLDDNDEEEEESYYDD